MIQIHMSNHKASEKMSSKGTIVDNGDHGGSLLRSSGQEK